MSEIPYQFNAIPDQFLTDDFLEDPVMMKLIRYIFKRIRYVDHEEIIKVNRQHRKVKLKPYEWIFGREKCAKECKVSERSIRTRIDQQIRTGYVKKVASSSTSTYTVYILVKEAFMKNTDQQFDQQIDQQFDQQFDHNLYIRDQISRDNEVVVDVRAPPPSGSDAALHSRSPTSSGAASLEFKDFVSHCESLKGDWSEAEMARAWESYEESSREDIQYPLLYAQRILENQKRDVPVKLKYNKNKKRRKQPCQVMEKEPSKKESASSNSPTTDGVTSINPLANWRSLLGQPKKSPCG